MKESKVLATVNGRAITEENVESFLEAMGPQRGAQFNSKEGKDRILEELIHQELFYLDAVDNNFEKDEAFLLELKRVKENLLKQYAVRKFLGNIKVDPEDVKQYYNENTEQFNTPESIRASHILVDDKNAADDILSKINEGMSFEAAATEYSNCPSKENGGDLGYFTKGKMVPEFEEAAFNLDKDEISNPVKTQFGYHLIKVVDKKDADIRAFDDIKDQLTNHLTAIKQNTQYVNKGSQLKDKYKVVINK